MVWPTLIVAFEIRVENRLHLLDGLERPHAVSSISCGTVNTPFSYDRRDGRAAGAASGFVGLASLLPPGPPSHQPPSGHRSVSDGRPKLAAAMSLSSR